MYEKWAAERAALRVANVKSIASEIVVDPSSINARTDEDIARAASDQLTWNVLVPDNIKVLVAKGWVTLQGETEWRYQREEAEQVVRSLVGVRGVSNEMQVKPKVSAAGVKSKIEDALKRDAQINCDHITVETAGSIVTLRGTVQSWREREGAEHAAFDAPGVASVSNLIEISH